MISPQATIDEFDQVLRAPVTLPVEFNVANPFVPHSQFTIDVSEWARQPIVRASESSTSLDVVSPGGRDDILTSQFDSQITFSTADVRRTPNNPYALDNCGLSYLNKGDFATAERYFRQALDLKPDLFAARLHLAKVSLLKGDHENALAVYRALRAERPRDRQVLLNTAQIHLQRRELRDAEECLAEALHAWPADA